jgi:DeoR/GlpR family transcriptional regulator of sugar metabolism
VTAVLLGGSLNRTTDNLVGAVARHGLEQLSFDAAFCSAYALHPDLGPCEPSPEDAEIKQLACERSAQVFVAINHQKIGERAAACWHPPRERATLATDLMADDDRITPLSTMFATIL